MASTEQADGIKFELATYFKEVDDYPLSDSFTFLVCLVGAYLLFVLKIGPDFMKNRKPYVLKNTILIYNAIQVILSVLFAYLLFLPMLKTGLIPNQCSEKDPETRKMMLTGVYIYFLGKLTELLDTVFFVLRKKYSQVTFLHVYHHSSVVIGTWAMFKYSISQSIVFAAFFNSLVHVVMYFYYFMSALGPQYQKYLTWKKHITTFQLVQFVSMFLFQVALLIFSKKCTFTYLGLFYCFFSSTLFFTLFSNFYKKSYNKTKAQTKENAQNVEKNGIAQTSPTNDKAQSEANTTNAQDGPTIRPGHKTKAH